MKIQDLAAAIVETREPEVAFTCPYCGGLVEAWVAPEAVRHGSPWCRPFIAMDALGFLTAARIARQQEINRRVGRA